MSHSGNVNTIVQNTTIYVDSVNQVRAAANLGSLPDGTSVSDATQSINDLLSKQVVSAWADQFPGVDMAGNDFGFMYPTSALQGETAPPCIVQQINLDFNNWELPGTTDIATQMAETITEELVARGGVLGNQQGSTQVNSNETIHWMVGFASVNISGDTGGYLYFFTAGLQI